MAIIVGKPIGIGSGASDDGEHQVANSFQIKYELQAGQ